MHDCGVSGFALHFAVSKIIVPLRRAVAGNAHPRCNLSFKSLSLNANANKNATQTGGVFIGGVSGFALHFAVSKIIVPLRRAVAGNAHPRCNLSFKSLSLNANANKNATQTGGVFIGGVRGI